MKKKTLYARTLAILVCIMMFAVLIPVSASETCSVIFMNGDTVYETMTVEAGDALVYPETDPVKDGYDFKGWSVEEGTIVSSYLVIDAVYTKPCTVTFWNGDTVHDTLTIDSGSPIEYPDTIPVSADGQAFVGWDVKYGTIIENDTDVYALFNSEAYLILDEFTDFVLYDHVVFDAFIDGVEESIKIKEVYTWNGNVKERKYNIADLGYGELSQTLTNMFGLHTYSVDADGFYVLTEIATVENGGTVSESYEYAIDLAPYINENGVITFGDYEAEKQSDPAQETNIRVDDETAIYIVNLDSDAYSVEIVKPASHFFIDLGTDNAALIADRIGYGNTDEVNTEIGTDKEIKYGVATELYIVIKPAEQVEYSNYKFVYVDEAISSRTVGDMDSFGLETGVEEEMYFKYAADGEAYTLNTLADVDEIYVQENTISLGSARALKAGVYLLNEENIAMDYVAKDDIVLGENKLTATDGVELPFYAVDLKASEIVLYNYDYITLSEDLDGNGYTLTGRNNVQTIKVRFFERNAGVIECVDKRNDALKEYLCETYPNGTDESIEVKVLMVPNTPTGFDADLSFTSNTLCGIAYETPDPEVAVEYTITFNLNAPADIANLASTFAGVTEVTAETVDGEFTVADIRATSDNYDFVGWATTADATTADAVAGDVLTPSADVTFYGVWETTRKANAIYGDANSDGKVTAVDGAYISRFLAGWVEYEAENLDLDMADVNLDGDVTALDSAIISRFLANWSGYTALPIEN